MITIEICLPMATLEHLKVYCYKLVYLYHHTFIFIFKMKSGLLSSDGSLFQVWAPLGHFTDDSWHPSLLQAALEISIFIPFVLISSLILRESGLTSNSWRISNYSGSTGRKQEVSLKMEPRAWTQSACDTLFRGLDVTPATWGSKEPRLSGVTWPGLCGHEEMGLRSIKTSQGIRWL